jgi:hypothetical protein
VPTAVTNAPTINFCNPNPCCNGGICTSYASSFICNCQSGFSGPTCTTFTQQTLPPVTNPCTQNQCYYGGTCVPNVHNNGFTCICAQGYDGLRCENIKQGTNACLSSPCNYGTCLPNAQTNGYTCLCQEGYTGLVVSCLFLFFENLKSIYGYQGYDYSMIIQ